MKLTTASMLLTLSVTASSSVLAHTDGIFTDSSGNAIRTTDGGCLLFGNPAAGSCADYLASNKHESMHATMTEEPVIKEVINLKGISFKTGSDELNASSHDQLDISAQDLKDNPKLKVIVAGHTDNVGDPAFNKDLSRKRAESVRTYLLDKGIDSSRLSARGYGDTQPDTSNDTTAGRAQNRRVELRIIE